MTSIQVYGMRRDLSHIPEGLGEVARLVEFPNWQKLRWGLPRDYDAPDRIEFRAATELLQQTDYPANDAIWPIFSRRLLDILLSIGEFPHRAVPLVMLTYDPAQFRAESYTAPQAENHSFVVVQLLERIEALDWENSVYTPHPRMENRVKKIQKFVAKEPVGGFPPLFRLSAYPAPLLLSVEAHSALVQAGVQGIIFEDVVKDWTHFELRRS